MLRSEKTKKKKGECLIEVVRGLLPVIKESKNSLSVQARTYEARSLNGKIIAQKRRLKAFLTAWWHLSLHTFQLKVGVWGSTRTIVNWKEGQNFSCVGSKTIST